MTKPKAAFSKVQKVKLTEKQYEVLSDHKKSSSSWNYDTFNKTWSRDWEWFGYRITMIFARKEESWEAYRECFMQKKCEIAIKKETPVSEIRTMFGVGTWTYDLEQNQLTEKEVVYGPPQ